MYNEQIKCQYLEDYFSRSTSKTTLRDMKLFQNKFERFANEIEIPLNKDLCQLSKEEVLNQFSKFLPPKRSTASGLMSLARQYSQWCCDNHLLGCTENPFANITLTDLDGWQSKSDLIKDFNMLVEILDNVLAPVREDYVDNLYRPVYCLLFYGFTLSEIVMLKLEDLNESECMVRHPATNVWVKIPKIVSEYLRYIRQMDSGNVKVRNGFTRNMTFYGDEYLIKRCIPERDSYAQSLFDKTSRIEKRVREAGYHIRFTVFSIMQAGIFSRIYEKEKETGNTDLSEFVNFRLREHTISDKALGEAYIVGNAEYAGWKKYYNL